MVVVLEVSENRDRLLLASLVGCEDAVDTNAPE